MRGDIITKIQDYDARDIRHSDAQSLFKSAGNTIKLVVHRDNKLAVTKNITSAESVPLRCLSTVPPYSPQINLLNHNESRRCVRHDLCLNFHNQFNENVHQLQRFFVFSVIGRL